jgi:fumarate hydratase subunit alpha
MHRPDEPALLSAIAEAVADALAEAEVRLPADVEQALSGAFDREKNPVARGELGNIIENITLAKEGKTLICQDTGIPVIYLTIPPDVPYTKTLEGAVARGVRIATEKIPLRPNAVDPCTRKNTGDNTGPGIPAIHVKPGDRLAVTVLPKGAGSENVSRIGMLLPTRRKDVKKFVVETVALAGGRPCPPVILGVGIGSTFDGVAALAKEALLLSVETMGPFEQELCDAVNALGIGPMGLGGNTTALAVKVKKAACHTASLPVAVNIQCWACRRATRVVEGWK